MDLPATFEAFMDTLEGDSPQAGWSPELRSLWFDAKGDWEASHEIAQDIPGRTGSWIHAYLHRKEGDRWNAGYWYRSAGQPFPECSLEAEFRELVDAFLSANTPGR